MNLAHRIIAAIRAVVDLPPEAVVSLVASLAVMVVVGSWLGWRLARAVVRRRFARHRAVGAAGERRGLEFLRAAGYRIFDVQVLGSYRLWVDGRWVRFDCRADAVVGRGRRVYVAEFKAGEVNGSIEYRATRRQLLEYWLAFDVDALLLVDVAQKGIVEVRPPRKVPPPRRGLGLLWRGSPAPRG